MSYQIPAIVEIQFENELKVFQALFEPPEKQHSIEMPYLSTSTWNSGRIRFTNPKLSFFYYHQKDNVWINDWMEETSNYHSSRVGYAHNFKKNIIIKSYNYEVLNTYILQGAYVNNWKMTTDFDLPKKEKLLFPEFFYNKLTREILIEKNQNLMMQIFTELELVIDRFELIS